MNKHTPGPWDALKGRDGNIRGIKGRHGPEIVNVINWNGISSPASSVGQANARLIAAAPELLEACMAAAEYDALLDDFTLASLRAAIAKATGEK